MGTLLRRLFPIIFVYYVVSANTHSLITHVWHCWDKFPVYKRHMILVHWFNLAVDSVWLGLNGFHYDLCISYINIESKYYSNYFAQFQLEFVPAFGCNFQVNLDNLFKMFGIQKWLNVAWKCAILICTFPMHKSLWFTPFRTRDNAVKISKRWVY